MRHETWGSTKGFTRDHFGCGAHGDVDDDAGPCPERHLVDNPSRGGAGLGGALSASAQLFFTPNWSFLAKFDGEFASGSQTCAGSGTQRYMW